MKLLAGQGERGDRGGGGQTCGTEDEERAGQTESEAPEREHRRV